MTATFSESMDPATITGSAFKLYRINPDRSKTRVNAAFTLLEAPSPGGLKAELDPFGSTTKALKPSTKYKAVVTAGARDLAGNALDQSPRKGGKQLKAWTFTTRRKGRDGEGPEGPSLLPVERRYAQRFGTRVP